MTKKAIISLFTTSVMQIQLDLDTDKLTELATVLLDKEVIFKDNLQKIFGDRPFSKADATFVEVASKEEKSDDNKKGETVTSDEEE